MPLGRRIYLMCALHWATLLQHIITRYLLLLSHYLKSLTCMVFSLIIKIKTKKIKIRFIIISKFECNCIWNENRIIIPMWNDNTVTNFRGTIKRTSKTIEPVFACMFQHNSSEEIVTSLDYRVVERKSEVIAVVKQTENSLVSKLDNMVSHQSIDSHVNHRYTEIMSKILCSIGNPSYHMNGFEEEQMMEFDSPRRTSYISFTLTIGPSDRIVNDR